MFMAPYSQFCFVLDQAFDVYLITYFMADYEVTSDYVIEEGTEKHT